jgi:hypothetical protein
MSDFLYTSFPAPGIFMYKSEKILKHTNYNGEEYLEKAKNTPKFPNSTAAVRIWMSSRIYI